MAQSRQATDPEHTDLGGDAGHSRHDAVLSADVAGAAIG